MSKKLEALFTDLDGSLLNDKKEIGELDLLTLQRLKEKGVKVFFATGRHHSVTRVYAEKLGFEYPFITCNGGLIYDFEDEKPVSAVTISKDALCELADLTESLGLTYYIYSDKSVFIRPNSPSAQFYHRMLSARNGIKDGEIIETKDYDFEGNNIIKFLVPDCPPEQLEYLKNTDIGKSGTLEFAYSGVDFLDINAAGGNKGTAVKKLSELYDFDISNTFAMGDNDNDISMLRSVGLPVVPHSAKDEIKEYADFVTASCNDNPITYAIAELFPELLN